MTNLEEIIGILTKYYKDFNGKNPDEKLVVIWKRRTVPRLWNSLLKMEEDEIIRRYGDIIDTIKDKKLKGRYKQILRGLFDGNIYISVEEAQEIRNIINDYKAVKKKYATYDGAAIINIIE